MLCCGSQKMFRHRLSAITVASISTLAMILTITAGCSSQFLKLRHEDSHSPMESDIQISDAVTIVGNGSNDHSHSTQDLHHIGLFSSSTSHSFRDDKIHKVAQGFYIFSTVLLCILVTFAWALSFLIRPTHRRWKYLSIAAVSISGFQIPVFLLFEAKACTSVDGQKCTLGDGFFMMLWSVISLALVTGLTQWWKCPKWWDVLTEWKVNHLRTEAALKSQLESTDAQDDGFGFGIHPRPSQEFGTATKFDRWRAGVARKINYRLRGHRFRHTLVNDQSYYDGLSVSDVENGRQGTCSGYLASPTIDNSRLLLCVTRDGKQVGDDRESQHSFEVTIEEHFHLSGAGSHGSSSSYTSSDIDSIHSISQDSSTGDIESQSHDGIPAQFSPARRAAALGRMPSHIGESGGNRSLSPFPTQELSSSTKLKRNGRPLLPQIKPENISDKLDSPEQDTPCSDQEEKGSASQNVEANNTTNENDKTSDCSDYKSSHSISSDSSLQTDHDCVPLTPPTIKEIDNIAYLNVKQIDSPIEESKGIPDDSNMSDFMSTCSEETEKEIRSLLYAESEEISSGSDEESSPSRTIVKLPLSFVDDSEVAHEDYHSNSGSKGSISLDEAIVAGANAAEESNNSTASDPESNPQSASDLDPEPQYYSSDESVTSSLSKSTIHSSSTYQHSHMSDAGLSNSECDTCSESESKKIASMLVQNLTTQSAMGLQHNRRRSKKLMKSSASSVCSKRSLLDYTIDEETDLDIEREKESDEETNNIHLEDMVVGGSPFKIQNTAIISPMRVGLGSSSPAFQKVSDLLPENSNINTEPRLNTDPYSGSRIVSPTRIPNDENNNNTCDDSNLLKSRMSRRKKRRAKVEASLQHQANILPVVSPTNDDKGHILEDEDVISAGSLDYPIISIPMKSSRRERLKYSMHDNIVIAMNYDNSSDEDASCLSGSISRRVRSARRSRLQRESITRSNSETTVRAKNDIITISAIVQNYGSDEASL